MFHINLKEVREEKGLTQEQLAKELNVVRQTVSKWERGLSMPDVDLLMKIGQTLDCTIDRLLGCSETVDMSELAIQLAMLNQQFTIKNNREEKVLDTIVLVLKILGGIFIGYITIMLLFAISAFLFFAPMGSGSSSVTEIYSENVPIEFYEENIE